MAHQTTDYKRCAAFHKQGNTDLRQEFLVWLLIRIQLFDRGAPTISQNTEVYSAKGALTNQGFITKTLSHLPNLIYRNSRDCNWLHFHRLRTLGRLISRAVCIGPCRSVGVYQKNTDQASKAKYMV